MAEAVLKSLLEDQIALNDVIEWLSNDVDELKVANENTVCAKGEFVLHILSLLRQSFLNAHQLSNSSTKSSSKLSETGGKTIKTKEKPNPTNSTVKEHPVKPQRTSKIIQDTPELRREDRSGLSYTFTPPDAKSNQGDTFNSSFKSTDLSLLRTPTRSPLHGDIHLLTPIQRKQRSTERDPRNRHSDKIQRSPNVDGRLKNDRRSLTLADFMQESANQKKHSGIFTPKSEKIAVSTPSHDSENNEDCNSSSPAWKNKIPQRRIKPTKILSFDDEKSPKSGFTNEETGGTVARAQGRSAFEIQADLDAPRAPISFAEDRSRLMDERLKLQNTSNQSKPLKPATPANSPAKSPTVKEEADPNKVTSRHHLLLLCDLYSSIIDANLIPNIMTELHFILSLLVVQRSSPAKKQNTEPERSIHKLKESIASISFDKSCIDISKEEKDVMNSEEKKVDKQQTDADSISPVPSKGSQGKDSPADLDTVHNCVFFATNLLWRQRHILATLDRDTIKLLLDNERVATFMPCLASAVQDMYTKVSRRTSAGRTATASSVPFNCSATESVSFHSERDNGTNFESLNSFRSFRKQRDAFYELIRIWESDRLKPSWNFNAALKPKIRALLVMCGDPTNYMHLARLFRMQLIAAVMGEKRVPDDLDSSFVECLRGVNPGKLNRLKGRLMKPYSSEGPRPPPQFPGHQEFFREFITAVDSVSFIEHLKDSLLSHLFELDRTDFRASDVEETDLVVDEETRQTYINCVTTMQLLAKFLGFIVFLPYKKAEDIPRNVIESELAIRSKVGPPLDVMACVVDAWTNRRLVVTLPWIVAYLGMLDEGSVELPVYRNTIVFLLQVYAGLASHVRKEHPENMAPKTELLLRFVLGWVFELPCLPDGFLFLWRRAEQDYLQGRPDNSLAVNPSYRKKLPGLNWSSSPSAAPLDSLDLVDTSVLYAVCPFLLGLRSLLATLQEANTNAAGRVQHIKRVSIALVQPEPVTTAQLELELEKSYINGLPESVRKTVEFVVERVATACNKHIRHTRIPESMERGREEFRNAVAEELKNGASKGTEERLVQRRISVVKQVVAELKTECYKDVEKICGERCAAALTALLQQDASLPPAACEMCIAIASRWSTERVIGWFQTNATFTNYTAELQDELKKRLSNKGVEKEGANTVEKTSHLVAAPNRRHDDCAPSPVDVVIDFRDLVCEILETHGEGISQEAVDKVVSDVDWLIKDRADVTPAAERTFSSLLLDLSVALVCHCPDLVTDAFIQRVVSLWKTDALRPTDNGLSRLVCPRNVLLLAQSSHPAAEVWNRLARIVGATLNEQLVSADDVESQCLTILHQDWPQGVLVNFSSCVWDIVRVHRKKSSSVDSEKFEYLLNWLAEITKYMEDFCD